ncbi:MAG TPA: hypothetical protein PKA50_14490 [Gemmatimonadales bacterium]|nr:hypothetical protein [Gemmatimonadales bacterium]
MTEPQPSAQDPDVLGRWTVDAARLREFTAAVREQHRDSPFPPNDLLKACDAGARTGLEVVCGKEVVSVGRWQLHMLYNVVSKIEGEERWILFEIDGGPTILPIPTARDGQAEAARVVQLYHQMAAEENRQYLEARNAPTWQNHLLNVAERHFPWVVLGFFFVVIPLLVILAGLLRGGFE